jgi:hypothetical protein
VHHRACNCAHRRTVIGAGQMLEGNVSHVPWWLQGVTQAPLTTPLSGKSEVRPSALAEYPSSGILPAPPPAPFAVPSSGVLQPPPERQTTPTVPVKIATLPLRAEALPATSATGRLRRTAAYGAGGNKRERLANSIASARAQTARHMKKNRIFAFVGDRRAPVLHSRW